MNVKGRHIKILSENDQLYSHLTSFDIEIALHDLTFVESCDIVSSSLSVVPTLCSYDRDISYSTYRLDSVDKSFGTLDFTG